MRAPDCYERAARAEGKSPQGSCRIGGMHIQNYAALNKKYALNSEQRLTTSFYGMLLQDIAACILVNHLFTDEIVQLAIIDSK